MKKYETPSYEIEYFKLKNCVLTDISENPDIDIDGDYVDDGGYGPAPAIF